MKVWSSLQLLPLLDAYTYLNYGRSAICYVGMVEKETYSAENIVRKKPSWLSFEQREKKNSSNDVNIGGRRKQLKWWKEKR